MAVGAYRQSALVLDEYGRAAGRIFLSHRPVVLEDVLALFVLAETFYHTLESRLYETHGDHQSHWFAKDDVFDLAAIFSEIDEVAVQCTRNCATLDRQSASLVSKQMGLGRRLLERTKHIYRERFGEELGSTASIRTKPAGTQ